MALRSLAPACRIHKTGHLLLQQAKGIMRGDKLLFAPTGGVRTSGALPQRIDCESKRGAMAPFETARGTHFRCRTASLIISSKFIYNVILICVIS
jgi:hypothetical protein